MPIAFVNLFLGAIVREGLTSHGEIPMPKKIKDATKWPDVNSSLLMLKNRKEIANAERRKEAKNLITNQMRFILCNNTK